MKRFAIFLLLLSLCLVCFGCSKEKETSTPMIRYEGSTAYYTQEDAKYTMELQFAKPVAAGSEIRLLQEEKEVLGFTTEAALSTLCIRSHKLEQNVAYSLTVNGVLQRHGVQKTEVSPADPGYIPDPTISTPPHEPMDETDDSQTPTEVLSGLTASPLPESTTEAPATESAPATSAPTETAGTDSTTDSDLSFSAPPANFNSDLSVEDIPSVTTSDQSDNTPTSGGVLPSESLLDGKGDGSHTGNSSSDSGDTSSGGAYDASGRLGSTEFVLTGTSTVFTSVRDAS